MCNNRIKPYYKANGYDVQNDDDMNRLIMQQQSQASRAQRERQGRLADLFDVNAAMLKSDLDLTKLGRIEGFFHGGHREFDRGCDDE